MDETAPKPAALAGRAIPWLVAGTLLAVYLTTLHPWLSISSLAAVSQIGSWDGNLPWQHPIYYLVTLPLRLVSAESLPRASNLLAAVLAALCAATLARCVALLPHDRTREQRMRVHGESSLLTIRLSWVPPLFSALVLGLQLTFWEHATTQTGEVLDLLLFAICVLCVLEYRLELNDSWLWRFAFVYGAAAANNWAMIGYGPAFLACLIWIRGVSFLNSGFIIRLVVWGLAGLSCYFVMPIAGVIEGGSSGGFWTPLVNTLNLQKNTLIGIPRGRIFFVGLVNLLPLIYIGIRWQGRTGSGLERLMASLAVLVLQVVWVAGNLFMAFDGEFSQRELVYLDPTGGGIPLLTFYFCGALAIGYFSGYFLLLGSVEPAKSWGKSTGVELFAGKVGSAAVLLATVAIPVLLVVRNWPKVQAENQPVLKDLSRELNGALPPAGAVAVSDDPVLYYLLLTEQHRRSEKPGNLLISTSDIGEKMYRQRLAKDFGDRWPGLTNLAKAEVNIASYFLPIWKQATKEGKAYLMAPYANFLTEDAYLKPAGPIFQVNADASGEILSPELTMKEQQVVVAYWDSHTASLTELAAAAGRKAVTAGYVARVWSRAANTAGVHLQRAGDLTGAEKLFKLAHQLTEENSAAEINLLVNKALKAKQIPNSAEVRKPLGVQSEASLYRNYGLIDEPQALWGLGRELIRSAEPSLHNAANFFLRAKQLAPNFTKAQLGFIAACFNAGHPDLALKGISEIQNRAQLSPEDLTSVTRFEAASLIVLKRKDEAERILTEAHQKNPKDTMPLELLSELYISQKRYEPASEALVQWLRLDPDDVTALNRQGLLLMVQKQYAKAVPLFDRILDKNSDHESARYNRAQCLGNLNKLDDARLDYEKLIRANPNNYLYRLGLGQIADRKNDTSEALKQFDAYLLAAPKTTEEYTNVAERVVKLRGSR
jgi:tetratricopeptide (TPR) repeat protein